MDTTGNLIYSSQPTSSEKLLLYEIFSEKIDAIILGPLAGSAGAIVMPLYSYHMA